MKSPSKYGFLEGESGQFGVQINRMLKFWCTYFYASLLVFWCNLKHIIYVKMGWIWLQQQLPRKELRGRVIAPIESNEEKASTSICYDWFHLLILILQANLFLEQVLVEISLMLITLFFWCGMFVVGQFVMMLNPKNPR